MGEAGMRRLPSADWLAFGVGMVAMVVQYIWPPALGLVLLAVITPSVLREVGLLKDADEFTMGVMHRAGFHALLILTLLVALNYVLPLVGLFDAGQHTFSAEPFPGEIQRKALVWVFLISYLIQYWGARGGVVRVLLGVAVMTLAPLAVLLKPQGYPWPGVLTAVTVGTAAVMVALAFLVRRRPRLGGGVLAAIFIVALAVAVHDMGDSRIAWAMVSTMLQAALVFGVTGVALLRETRTKEAEL